MNLVFVCTSNTCRSPVAEQFAVEWFKRRLNLTREQQEEKGIKIRSAAYVHCMSYCCANAAHY